MTHQILLNVNFCDDIEQRKVERDGRKIAVMAGYSLSGIRLVPQELCGVGIVYISGGARAIRLQEINSAHVIEKSCAFAIVQPDMSFRCDALEENILKKVSLLLNGYRQRDNVKAGTNELAENITAVIADEIAEIASECQDIWDVDKMVNSRTETLEKMICENYGHVSLPELADAVGCTVRHVHRTFAAEVGKGPKEFSRIVRIRETVVRMFEDPKESISNYMEGMGYSDQAHFQREFKWYTGYTPGNFIKLLRDGTYHV